MLSTNMDEQARPAVQPRQVLFGISAALAAGLIVYSQTDAFAWDEGFHLLAAQLIRSGKRPYLDFFFPQTPLNAYWNALWMRLFGDTWRVAHAVAALSTAGAIWLTGDYVLRRFPVAPWRLAAAVAAMAAFALNVQVVEFGAIAQAYGLCLLLVVAAFRATIAAVGRPRPWMAAGAGFLSAAAAGSSLLTAPVAPVLLVWMILRNHAGSRWRKGAAFIVGGVAAFAPLLVLLAESPARVIFNVVKFHLLYRQTAWSNAIPHDIGVLFAWVDSTQAALTGLLALAGWIGAARDWRDDRLRWELYLCGWLSAAIAIHLSTAHPTFERYFLFVVPFLGILAAAGLYFIAGALFPRANPAWAALAFAVLFGVALAKQLVADHDGWVWPEMEQMASEVGRVTPAGAPLFADEHVFFLLKRTPPAGMESADSHKLEFPADEAARLGIIPKPVIERQLRSGWFATVQMCSEAQADRLGIAALYANSKDVEDCTVYWGR